MWAPARTAAVTAAAVPKSRAGRRHVADGRRQERLARRPRRAAAGPARPARAGAPAARSCAPASLGEPQPGSRMMRLARHAGRRGRRRGSAAARRRPRDHVARSAASRYISRDRPRVCISTSAAPACGDRHGRDGGIIPQAADIVHDRRALVERGARPPRPCRCRWTAAPAARPGQPPQHGQDARELLVDADTGSAPGRVDSPADVDGCRRRASSIRSASSAAAPGPCAATPSANESGVTLRMPMTSVRSPRSSARPSGSGTAKRVAGKQDRDLAGPGRLFLRQGLLERRHGIAAPFLLPAARLVVVRSARGRRRARRRPPRRAACPAAMRRTCSASSTSRASSWLGDLRRAPRCAPSGCAVRAARSCRRRSA